MPQNGTVLCLVAVSGTTDKNPVIVEPEIGRWLRHFGTVALAERGRLSAHFYKASSGKPVSTVGMAFALLSGRAAADVPLRIIPALRSTH